MKTKTRQLTQLERNFLLMLKHKGYMHIKYALALCTTRRTDLIRASNADGTKILDFCTYKFTQISPLDGKVLITDFLEGNI